MVREVQSTQEWATLMQKDWVIVDFHAQWCGPCKKFAPAFERMEPQYPACTFCKVDVDQLDSVAGEQGVRAMPTFILYNKGRKVDTVMGANEAKVRAVLDRHVPKGGSGFGGGGHRLGSGPSGGASLGPSDLFFSGTVTEAIAAAKAANKPLVVFLDGGDEASREMNGALHRVDLKSVIAGRAVVLRLPENLEAPPAEVAQYAGARMFRQVYPTDTLPTLAVIGVSGKPLLFHKGRMGDKMGFAKSVEAAVGGQDMLAAAQTILAAAARVKAAGGAPSASEAGPSAPAPKPVAPAAAPAAKPKPKADVPPPSPPVFDTVSLSLRLLDGSNITASFDPLDPLSAVYHHIDLNRTDGGAPYALALAYPRTVFTAADREATLKDLGLGPRSALLLLPVGGNAGSHAGSQAAYGRASSSAAPRSLYGSVTSTAAWALRSVVGGASWILGVGQHAPPPMPPQEPEGQEPEAATGGRADSSAGPSSSVPAAGGARGRVVGMKDVRGAEAGEGTEGRGPNSFWNGNSTAFEAGPSGKDGRGQHND